MVNSYFAPIPKNNCPVYHFGSLDKLLREGASVSVQKIHNYMKGAAK